MRPSTSARWWSCFRRPNAENTEPVHDKYIATCVGETVKRQVWLNIALALLFTAGVTAVPEVDDQKRLF